jgi:hypothetical protein
MAKPNKSSNSTSKSSPYGAAAGDIAESEAAARATIAAQNRIAQIQNEIALNQAKNSIIEELGKGVKALAQ